MFTFKLTRLVITGFLTLAILCGGMNVATTGGLGPVPAYADDGDDLLLSIVPVLAAQSRLRLGLQVDAPGTGEALTAGSWYTIAWQGAPSTEMVDIQLSTDGGATYPITVATGVTNDLQSYIWGPVPFFDPAKLSSSCKIKIRDTAHPQTIFAESAGLFSLQAAADVMTVGDLDDINYSLEFDPEGIEQDSDGDGMYDNLEIYLGTDPLNWDSDRDGLDDYWEVFGDVSDVPVPDKDGDSKIAPLDNDDDNDGLNDGRALDDDGDGIPNYLETYGFVYIPTAPQRYQPWDGDIGDTYYKTNPRQASTDQDQYGDSMEVSKINMDLTVESPGDNPMIAAFPNFVVKLIDYDVELNSTITETNGSVHTDSSDWNQTIEESTSVTDEWHWEVGTEVSASLSDFGGSASFSYGQSQSTTSTRGTARSQGGSMSDATQWSQASSTNPSEAAKIKMNLQVRNVGTCVAQAVSITLNLQIGGKNIATLTHPTPPGTIDRLIVDQSINWVSDWITLTFDELRALRTGAPVTIEITGVSANVVKKEGDEYVYVNDWGLYFTSAENTSARLFLDLGDGNTTEHLVYAGNDPWEPVVTLKDALIWAVNGYETPAGPFVRFYQPDGGLGDPALLEGWYFSLDENTYERISGNAHNPDFDLFDTVLAPDSVIVAKAPPVEPTPKIHWSVLSPRDGMVTAFVDDYFFTPGRLEVYFVDKNDSWHPMTWNADKLYFSWACPDDYFKDGTEKIVARNPIYNNPDDPKGLDYETELPAAEMDYLPGFRHPYPHPYQKTAVAARRVQISGERAYVAAGSSGLLVMDASDPNNLALEGSCITPDRARQVFVEGSYAYVVDRMNGLQVIDIVPGSPDYLNIVASCDTPGNPEDIFVTGNYAYVADLVEGLQVIDISDPPNVTNASLVATCNTPGAAYGVFAYGGYAYVADYSTGLQVINISDPQNVTDLSLKASCATPGTARDVVVRGGFAFIADDESGLQVIDVSNPESVTDASRIASCDTPGSANEVFVTDSHVYVADGQESGLQVIDAASPASIDNNALVGSYETSGGAYGVSFYDGFAFVADAESGLQAVDVGSPASPVINGFFKTPGSADGVFISGNYAYVADNMEGLQVLDISDPLTPVQVGSCDTPGYSIGVFVADGYAYVVESSYGLQVIDVRNPENVTDASLVGSCDTPGWARAVFVSGSFAYVADAAYGLQVIDVSNPSSVSNASIIGACDTESANGVFISGGYAYVADGSMGLKVIDVSNPYSVSDSSVVGTCNTIGMANDVFVSDNYAYVADLGSGIQVIDVSNPITVTDASIVGACDTPGNASKVFVSDDHAYVGDADGGLQVIRVSDPESVNNASIVGNFDTLGYCKGVMVEGNHVFMADLGNGLRVIEFK